MQYPSLGSTVRLRFYTRGTSGALLAPSVQGTPTLVVNGVDQSGDTVPITGSGGIYTVDVDTSDSGLLTSGSWAVGDHIQAKLASMTVDGVSGIGGWIDDEATIGPLEVDLIDAPNATAIAAFQNGLATATDVSTSESNIRGGTETLESLKDDIAAIPTSNPSAADVAAEVDTVLSGTHGAGSWEDAGGSAPTAEEIADEVRVELATELARIDANISSRSSHTAANVRAEIDANSTQLAAILDAIDGLENLSGAGVEAALAAYGAATGANVTAAQTAILAKLLKWFQLIARKDAGIATDNATELAQINANGGSGAGTFNNQTDALESLRDRGDAAYLTATGFATPANVTDAVTSIKGTGEAKTLAILSDEIATRSSHSAADVDTALTNSHGSGSWQTATGFATPADVPSKEAVAAEVDEVLSAAHGSGDWEQPALEGPWAINVTVTNEDGGAGIQGFKVRIYETGEVGEAKTTISDGTTEDAFGGTNGSWNYVAWKLGWATKTGTFTIAGEDYDLDIETTLTAPVTPPDMPDQSTCWAYAIGADGEVEEGATFHCRLLCGDGTAGFSHDTATVTVTSDADGYFEFTGRLIGKKYFVWRGDDDTHGVDFTPTSAMFPLPEFIGQETE